MAEDRQEVMALYQARHRTTARRRFHATTEAGPGGQAVEAFTDGGVRGRGGRIREARRSAVQSSANCA